MPEMVNPGCANGPIQSIRLTPDAPGAPAQAECVMCQHNPHPYGHCPMCRTSLRLTRIEVALDLGDGNYGYL